MKRVTYRAFALVTLLGTFFGPNWAVGAALTAGSLNAPIHVDLSLFSGLGSVPGSSFMVSMRRSIRAHDATSRPRLTGTAPKHSPHKRR